MTNINQEINALVSRLSLVEKVRLLTGQDSWSLYPLPSIGLRSIVLSDGPAGVRGATWDERDPSVNFPSPTSVSASWDIDMQERIGHGLGSEARRKGVDVLLAPTINIQRSPYGGRHFEAFSEDPLLTSCTATAYVRGVQAHGVGATVKHYVANDAETERFTASSDVDERTLREVYLAAFEPVVTQGSVWLVMSAYNSINGITASEHPLLTSPLKDEWGFDGVVVSDWTAVRSVVASAQAAQDLAMPGPASPWAEGLLAAVEAGEVPEAAIDDKVRRILVLASRVGALASTPQPERAAQLGRDEAVAVARAASAAGTVLLSNDGVLPLANPKSIAVIGEGAVFARVQGGGSATVLPTAVITPMDALAARFPDATVSWSRGAVVQSGLANIPVDFFSTPEGQPGMLVRYLDSDGVAMDQEVRTASRIVSFDAESKAARSATVEMSFTYHPHGLDLIGVAGLSDFEITVDGAVIGKGELRTKPGDDPATAILNPPFTELQLPFAAGPLNVVVRFKPVEGGIPGSLALGVGLPPVRDSAQKLIAEAVAAATAAEVAVVVVSTSEEVESEGFDRTSLGLPGQQDALVRAVLSANPRTVVVVNSGSPVVLPWADDAAAILATWFPGQEFGNALADVLSGDVEPGGRLPVTWPRSEADVPVFNVTPTDGHLAYTEGVHVGYRAWLRAAVSPAFPFGHGLGYTTWSIAEASVDGSVHGGDATLRVRVKNTGMRSGKAVIQVYAAATTSDGDLPQRWLVGFAPTVVRPGDSTNVLIPLSERRFQTWDGLWVTLKGEVDLLIGFSVAHIAATVRLTL